MKVIDTCIDDVKLIELNVHGDHRGYFMETFQARRYQDMLGIDLEFVQDNHSGSSKDVLRGLHFQKNQPQGKLVRVVRGSVFDVAVDIRVGSPTFGCWAGAVLSEENRHQFWVPPGFAHGFLVLSDFADFEYKCTAYYDAADECCLSWDDPTVGIEWPESNPRLSEKDQCGLSLAELPV